MKKIVVAFLFLGFSLSLAAQRVYFVYLQSEKQAPFYVRMGDKVHSSTFSGYLILSSLKDSTYLVTLGFPGNTRGESKFNLVVNNKDKGFLIKEMDEGTALFDLQDLTLLRSASSTGKATGQQAVLRTDAFTKLLSQTSDDASLLTASVVVPEVPKAVPAVETTSVATKDPEIVKQIETVKQGEGGSEGQTSKQTETAKADAVVPPVEISRAEPAKELRPVEDTTSKVAANEEVKATEGAQTEIKEVVVADSVQVPLQEAAPATSPFVRSIITRRSESSTTEGFGLVFLDNQDGNIDTIRLLIPSTKIQFKETAPNTAVESDTELISRESAPALVNKPLVSSISNCNLLATEKDFFRLRRIMAAATSEDGMLGLARKQFKARCYTTEQVKNLSRLFLTSASKYQFFDLAYPAVSDRSTFSELAAELEEDYYVKRFKALIGE